MFGSIFGKEVDLKASFEFVKASLFNHWSCSIWYLSLAVLGLLVGGHVITPDQVIYIVIALIFGVLSCAFAAYQGNEETIELCLTWALRFATVVFVLCCTVY
jgi:hypothetical protein